MKDKITRTYNPGDISIEATFDGTRVDRFWKDAYLYDSLVEATDKVSYDEEDIYTTANFIFQHLNQLIKRHYSGQELMLESVSVWGINSEGIIEVTR